MQGSMLHGRIAHVLTLLRQRPITAAAAAVAAAVLHIFRRQRLAEQQRLALEDIEDQPPPTGLIFTGTGCSSGLPLTGCTLGQEWAPKHCAACGPALRNGPSDPNWRGNAGALIRFIDKKGTTRHVQIDCGKTFREITAMRVYRQHGIKSLDGLLLTHDHADAVGGLDELRSLQSYDPETFEIGNPIRCVCDRRSMTRLRHMFPYLFPKPLDFGTGLMCQCCELDLEKPSTVPSIPAQQPTRQPAPAPVAAPAAVPVVKRFVARIEWEAFGSAADLTSRVCVVDMFGLKVTCMPVMHGEDYVCFGFGFGPEGARCAYLSDYTRLLPPTETLLASWSCCGGLALLVLDALNPDGTHPVHASLDQSVALARLLKPRRTLLLGMGHRLEHYATNRSLRKLWDEEQLDIQLAFDGQLVPLDLTCDDFQ